MSFNLLHYIHAVFSIITGAITKQPLQPQMASKVVAAVPSKQTTNMFGAPIMPTGFTFSNVVPVFVAPVEDSEYVKKEAETMHTMIMSYFKVTVHSI